ncbi:MAG: AmmeMemoRadiSam system protein A [Terriglobales bacterium]
MSPPPSAAATRPTLKPVPAEYSDDERRLLLKLAHQSIEALLDDREVDTTPPTPHLGEKRGAFTTLHLDGQLRGCVGYVFPVHSLYQTVAETAAAAAFRDIRFYPVTREEAPRLKIELSILSPLRNILPGQVEIGVHGLVITEGPRRGLLLPQVPIEHGWDRETFLCQTCVKAGLAADAWKSGAVLECFTAEVFGEI